MPTQTVISINRQTPIMGPATFYPRVVVERLQRNCDFFSAKSKKQRLQGRCSKTLLFRNICRKTKPSVMIFKIIFCMYLFKDMLDCRNPVTMLNWCICYDFVLANIYRS